MPRVKALRTKYMRTDAKKMFVIKMAGEGIKQKDLAETIGISPSAFSIRWKNFNFDFEELVKMIDRVGFTDSEILKMIKMEVGT